MSNTYTTCSPVLYSVNILHLTALLHVINFIQGRDEVHTVHKPSSYTRYTVTVHNNILTKASCYRSTVDTRSGARQGGLV